MALKCKLNCPTVCTFLVVLLSIVLYQFSNVEEILHIHRANPLLLPPIIEDTFADHRKSKHITKYEVTEMFIVFVNPNTKEMCAEDMCIIFYTINGTDPRKYGIPFDDDPKTGSGILLKVDTYKPVVVHATIGKLKLLHFFYNHHGVQNTVLFPVLSFVEWSANVSSSEFWNPDALNHSRRGAGFMRSPQILSDTHTIGYMFAVRLWPRRMSDTIKCVWDHNRDSDNLKDEASFWWTTSPWLQKTMDVSRQNFMAQTYVDLVFDMFHENNHRFKHQLIWMRCSTTTRSPKETAENTLYSSLLMATRPSHTQLLPFTP